jgi:hypothetical protein
VVQLTLDMPVQGVKANVHVEADKDRIALQRGPIVYCLEGTDNGGAVQNLIVPAGTKFTPRYQTNLLGGVATLSATATGVFKTAGNQVVSVPFQVMATPYYANANRGTCQMQVWIPEKQVGFTPQNQE